MALYQPGFDIVVAYSFPQRGIGYEGKLPWKISEDLKRFKKITTTTHDPSKLNVIIMGRRTFASIGNRPLPNRYNFVLTRNSSLRGEAIKGLLYYWNSLDEAIETAFALHNRSFIESVFVIGGQEVYQEAIKSPYVRQIVATEINNQDGPFDAYFPLLDDKFQTTSVDEPCQDSQGNIYTFVQYTRLLKHPEEEYLKLMKKVLEEGEYRETRNSKTYSLFGESLEFNIYEYGFPLLTTKKVFFRGVAEELFWFLKGSTDVEKLREKRIHIWDANTTQEYKKIVGLDGILSEGDCGPIYGFQWRHFGAPYIGHRTNYTGAGFDQIKTILDTIENGDFNCRRMVLSAWNPPQLKTMVLPPCHILYQFYIRGGKFLDCQMYQRSADLFLGLPFNIASTALLVNLICATVKKINLQPGKIKICLGDLHIYEDHLKVVKEQCRRKPYPFPHLTILQKREKIEEYTFEDLKLDNYQFHEPLRAPMIA